jgi:hypothetical protein
MHSYRVHSKHSRPQEPGSRYSSSSCRSSFHTACPRPAVADSVMGVSLFREQAPEDFGVFTLGLYSMFRLTAGETQVRTGFAPLVR